jgi:hypothetical protein
MRDVDGGLVRSAGAFGKDRYAACATYRNATRYIVPPCLLRYSQTNPPSPHQGKPPSWHRKATDPLGCPVNLSSRMVTRFMEPHSWKCAWISSGDAP